MELPDIGKQCTYKGCSQLDFLPYTCYHCKHIYCQEHFKLDDHHCPSLNDPSLDVRVPTCPICEKPVSVPRGEDPNIKVNQHIQNNCATPKPLDNTCRLKGCKQKLLVPMTCSECRLSYCVKHRLGIDHQCPGKPAPAASPSALAAIRRANKAKQTKPQLTKTEIEANKQEISRLQAKAKTGRLAESEEIRLATLLSMKDQGSDKCILS